MIAVRLDKYLKVSRIIKRRTVANEACDRGHVSVNGRVAKPSTDIGIGDRITIRFGERTSSFIVKALSEHVSKESASEMYQLTDVADDE